MAQTKKANRAAYDLKTYQDYKIRIRRKSDLNSRVAEYKQAGHSLNHLITDLLCKHFGEPFPHPELDNDRGTV
jgi:hypothetical protein